MASNLNDYVEPLDKRILKNGMKTCYVTCLSTIEELQAGGQAINPSSLPSTSKRKKRKKAIAENEGFYDPDKPSSSFLKKSTTSIKKEVVEAHQQNLKKRKCEKYLDVEFIVNFKVIKGARYYLIKWSGWPREANTWEPVDNLDCSVLIVNFQKEYISNLHEYINQKNLKWPTLLAKKAKTKEKKGYFQKVFDATPLGFKFHSAYDIKKSTQTENLRRKGLSINKITKGSPKVALENEVDLEDFPEEFTYTNSNIAGRDVEIPTDAMIGCFCDKCDESEECCPNQHKDCTHAYDALGMLRSELKPGKAIIECNSSCKCDKTCSNRIVQHGSKHSVSIFKTSAGKGWGVKALAPIPRRSFVTEYVGEVITNGEAEERGVEYSKTEGAMTYLFDLDYIEKEDPLVVDATKFGNLSHFINHSCSPNLQVYNVFVDNVDAKMPRIALFARKNIAINEELTFDYQMNSRTPEDINTTDASTSNENGTHNRKLIPCLCQAINCRKFLMG